jgi:hypothetical protein
MKSSNPKLYSEYLERVTGPGKFEGEQPYVPYYWDNMEWGLEDEDTLSLIFIVNDEDKALFPELNFTKEVCLAEDGNGFVFELN